MESSLRETREVLLSEVKDHVVQLEAMVLYTLVTVVVLFFVGQNTARLGAISTLAPLALLAGVPAIVRVTNPKKKGRDRLNWAIGLGGFLGLLVGAAADVASMGLTLGQGTLIGATLGAVVGGAFGPTIEDWRNKGELMEHGAAFEFLFENRDAHPHLANPNLITEALDKIIPSFDINNDGRRWYLRDHLQEYLSRGKNAKF